MSPDPDDIVDAMLREAIAASLRDGRQGPSSPSGQREFVDLTIDSDSEKDSDVEQIFPKSKSIVGSDTDKSADEEEVDYDDEDLKAALALSLEGVRSDDNNNDDGSSVAKVPNTQAPPEASSLLGMDRKQMERERLARLVKRKVDDGDDTLAQSPKKAIKVQATGIADKGKTEPSKNRASAFPDTSPICKQFATNSLTCTVKPTAHPIPQWPLGAVQKTAMNRAPRLQGDITIEEVLQHGDLELAVLSSFLWDMDWLFSKLSTRRTQFVLVMSAKEEVTRLQYLEETKGMHNLSLCFPPMEGQVNCMHSKLMLLFHPEYVRIVVPTANLTSTDWGENNLMENSVFLIDLPKLHAGMPRTSKPAFYDDLVYYLKATTLDEEIIKKLDNFDFRKTARYAFVHTIGGSHRDAARQRTGYCGLGRAVTSLGFHSTDPIKVDYVTSSVGALTGDFLRAIYLACKGDDGNTEYSMRNAKNASAAASAAGAMLKSAKEWADRFHVYFPSEATVRGAHSHPELTAGTICFQSGWWGRDSFPHDALKDCVSERGVLMHNKLIYVSPSTPIRLPDKSECKGWAYVGSANLSESAWGKVVKDRETKRPRLNCRNWECGVLIPIITGGVDEEEETHDMGSAFSVHRRLGGTNDSDTTAAQFSPEVFRDIVPVPMKTPATGLSHLSEKGKPGYRGPWFFMER